MTVEGGLSHRLEQRQWHHDPHPGHQRLREQRRHAQAPLRHRCKRGRQRNRELSRGIMLRAQNYIEWKEPLGVPENPDNQLRYRTLVAPVLRSLVIPTALFVALTFFVALTGTKRQVRMVVAAYFVLMAIGAAALHLLLLLGRRLRRCVRITHSDVEYRMFTLERKWCYEEISRIVIESTGHGDHRMILVGPSGEFCRLRIPGTVDLDAVTSLLPADKLTVPRPVSE